jgi:hypothetical protein
MEVKDIKKKFKHTIKGDIKAHDKRAAYDFYSRKVRKHLGLVWQLQYFPRRLQANDSSKLQTRRGQ